MVEQTSSSSSHPNASHTHSNSDPLQPIADEASSLLPPHLRLEYKDQEQHHQHPRQEDALQHTLERQLDLRINHQHYPPTSSINKGHLLAEPPRPPAQHPLSSHPAQPNTHSRALPPLQLDPQPDPIFNPYPTHNYHHLPPIHPNLNHQQSLLAHTHNQALAQPHSHTHPQAVYHASEHQSPSFLLPPQTPVDQSFRPLPKCPSTGTSSASGPDSSLALLLPSPSSPPSDTILHNHSPHLPQGQSASYNHYSNSSIPSSPSATDFTSMPSQFAPYPQAPGHARSPFNLLSQYATPSRPNQNGFYPLPQPNSVNSMDELKPSTADTATATSFPKESFQPLSTDSCQKKPSTASSDKPSLNPPRRRLIVGYRRLLTIALAALLLIGAAIGVIIFAHRHHASHTAAQVAGGSDGDIISQSGLGSARNPSSGPAGSDPSNPTTAPTGTDNGLRGGANGYDSLVVFGASYCDNAHARPANLQASLKPSPYFKGRWTNGYVWNEYLSAMIGPGGGRTTLVNYAYGSATVDNSLNQAAVPDLEQQVTAFLSDLSAQSPGAGPSSGKSLIAIWVGINSVTKIWNGILKEEVKARTRVEVLDSLTKAQVHVNATVDKIFSVVTNLVSTPAYKAAPPDIMLLPIPPAQLLLVNIRAVKNNASALRTLAALNDLYNARFGERLASFQASRASDQSVFTLDIPSIWHKFIEQPTSAQLTVVDEPCVTKEGTCSSPDSYLFWDTLHPTTHIHKLLAKMMNDEIKR